MSGKKEVVTKNETESYGDKVSEVYEMKDLHNHILTRPDSYIGSIHSTKEYFYVPMDDENGDPRMVYTPVEYIQGLFKIVDEIIVNARDQYVRQNTSIESSGKKKIKDFRVSNIWIKADQQTGKISIKNDGNGVPIAKHTKEKIYIPEMVFGHLLTSSNYKEGVRRFTGGKNGYGAKCTNIYSSDFLVETVDHLQKKKYTQHFKNNMYEKDEPTILNNYSGDPYTLIEFTPDYKKFGLEGMTDDFFSLIKARAYDIAGCTDQKVSVHFNNCLVRVNDFEDYVKMHFPKENRDEIVYQKVNSNWEIAIAPNFSSELTGKQISFANGARTIKGGRHIQYIFNQIYRGVSERLKKKKETVKESILRYNMMIFVNCTIDSPAFDGQTKEELTTEIKKLYPTCVVPEKFIDQIMKTSIIENAIQFGKATQGLGTTKASLTRKSILRDIPKLEDANEAGGKNWKDCILIITEGDSAKAMVMEGITNRDRYGVFPIRGKLLNVMEATIAQIKDNAEINNLLRILGITGKYVKGQTLRYGKLMIMTDQDLDGAHIKGLVLNFIKYLGLDKMEDFSCSLITPIVKVTKGKIIKSFYSSQEFDKWLANNNNGKGWKTKYYKGLGTSTAKEAREYFKNIDDRVMTYKWDDKSEDSINLAFSKDKINDRKTWLVAYDPTVEPDYSKKVNVSDFFNKEFIHFSNYDNVRSISNLCDGLKPSQRKILYCAFEKRNLKEDVKVAQFGAAVAEETGYHHGEVSLFGAIINMAQDYIGSNNINLLVPSGQFGSRYMNGKDSSAPRYIFTRLSPITSMIFKSEDRDLLKQLTDDDGKPIEPEWYLPIVPMCLVNGTDGIGTGFATGLAPFNLTDIIANLRLMMKGQEPVEMIPWFRGYSKNISTKKIGHCSYVIKGKYTIDIESDTLHVTELPIGVPGAVYKEYLSSLLGGTPTKSKAKGKKGSQSKSRSSKFDHRIRDFTSNSAGNKVDFKIFFEKGALSDHMINAVTKDKNGITTFEKQFKLATTYSFPGKIVLYDRDNKLKVYGSVEEILKDFYSIRLEYYNKRREHLLKTLAKDSKEINIKAKFIKDVIEGQIILFEPNKKKSRSKIQISADLEKAGYPMMVDKELVELENMDDMDRLAGHYDYLLSMQLVSLTQEKIDVLLAKKKEMDDKYKELKAKTGQNLWEEDLVELETQYQKDLKIYMKNLEEMANTNSDNDSKGKKGVRKTVTKTVKKTSSKK